MTLDDYYRAYALERGDAPAELDDALRAIFCDPGGPQDAGARSPAAAFIRSLARVVPAEVYRWTGWFPERARHLLEQLAERAEQRGLTCPATREPSATVALTAFVTALALSRIQGGGQPA